MKKTAIILITIVLIISYYTITSSSKTKDQMYKKNIINILELANKHVGKKFKRFKHKNRYFRSDCSGFIQFLFGTQNIIISDSSIPLKFGSQTEGIYLFSKAYYRIHKNKIPKKGDLIFFHNTFDRNNDNKVNDLFTHIAIVDYINSDGTIYYIHNINKRIGVKRDRMNLIYPNSRAKNSYIRNRKAYPHYAGKYLSGQLFALFATVRP